MVAVEFTFEFTELLTFVHDGFGDDGSAGGADEITVFAIEDELGLIVVIACSASLVLGLMEMLCCIQ